MSVVNEIAAAIKRNPKIKRVIVSQAEREIILAEMDNMTFIKPAPRPTYGGPFGNIDRQLWDELENMKKYRDIRILDRPVETRA